MTVYGQSRIACITGGTGFRQVAVKLVHLPVETVHIIGTADSGRSTRQLRLFFDIPAIGDIRSRLIDLADRNSKGYHQATALLAHRLPAEGNRETLEAELEQIVKGEHHLVLKCYQANPNFTNIILAHLRTFNAERKRLEEAKGQTFDLRQGSLGNFFLVGAYLYYKGLGSAILEYHSLAGVKGQVIPATEEKVHLAAELANGRRIIGQHEITKKADPSPIEKLSFLGQESEAGRVIEPPLDEQAFKAIQEADLLVFSMGSFYTSILSTLHLTGMSEAVRLSRAAHKVFIVNTLEDPEITGLTVNAMVDKLVATLRANGSQTVGVNNNDYLDTVILGNTSGALGTRGGRRFIQAEPFSLARDFSVLEASLALSGESEGYYEPQQLAEQLVRLA